jgi:hypothetical protein
MEKLKIQQFMIAKKREDVLQSALLNLGLKPEETKHLSREDIQASFEPFKSGNVMAIKRGDFKLQKIPKIVLEVIHVEMIGNCY